MANNDKGNRQFDLPSDSVELRAFLRAQAETGEIEVSNVWQFAVVLLGDPPTDVGVCVHFQGEPDEGEQLTLGFQIDQARSLHKLLGEQLDQL